MVAPPENLEPGAAATFRVSPDGVAWHFPRRRGVELARSGLLSKRRLFMRHYALVVAAAATALAGCVVEVRESEPKGGCLYHCEGKACCEEKVTEAYCQAKLGTWSNALKDCPDD
jgi:hypothetical protein